MRFFTEKAIKEFGPYDFPILGIFVDPKLVLRVIAIDKGKTLVKQNFGIGV